MRHLFRLIVLATVSVTLWADFDVIRAVGNSDLNAILNHVEESTMAQLPEGSSVRFEEEVDRILRSKIIGSAEKLQLLARSVLRRVPPAKQEIVMAKAAPNLSRLFGGNKRGEIAAYLRQLRVAFFTGVFNPLHNGHVLVVRSGVEQMVVDRIHVLPTVHTTHNEVPINWLHRRNMINAGLFFIPEFVEVDTAFRSAFEKGTGEALALLFSRYRKNAVQWIHCMGADSFARFVEHGYLDAYAKASKSVLLVEREGVEQPPIPPAYANIVYALIPDAGASTGNSSTKVRKAIAAHEEYAHMVPAMVKSYIEMYELYR